MTKRKVLICIDKNPLLSVVAYQLFVNHSLVVHSRHTKDTRGSLIIGILPNGTPITVETDHDDVPLDMPMCNLCDRSTHFIRVQKIFVCV